MNATVHKMETVSDLFYFFANCLKDPTHGSGQGELGGRGVHQDPQHWGRRQGFQVCLARTLLALKAQKAEVIFFA
jgi:hypothetical protein